MRHGCRASLLTAWGALLGICAGAGCQAVFRLPELDSPVTLGRPAGLDEPIQPALSSHDTLHWSIELAVVPPGTVLSGEGTIGPDGSLELGPYGQVVVAGQTLDKARTSIGNQLAHYVKDPRVTLRQVAGQGQTSSTTQVVWRPHPKLDGAMAGPDLGLPGEAPTLGRPVADTEPAIASEQLELSLSTKGEEPASKWRTAQSLDPAGNARVATDWTPAVAVARQDDGPMLPKPMPLGPTGKDKPAAAEPPKPAAKTSTTLPAPRRVPPTAEAGQVAYPEIGHGPGMPVPREGSKATLPPYIVEPPDVLLIESTQKLRAQPITGPHLVRPDGTVGLGIYGSARVAGLTLDMAKVVIAEQLATRIKDFDLRELSVDVLNYNSKFYYVIADRVGSGEQVARFPITGNETVLDAIYQVSGLPPEAARKKIWVARSANGHHDDILPVDWAGISQRGERETNYQLMPNDRVYVKASKLVKVDFHLAKILSPIERLLGVTLLGSSTYNSIQGRGNNFGGQ